MYKYIDISIRMWYNRRIGGTMKKISIIVKVLESTHHAFKMACLKLRTTMSAVLRDAIAATIARAGREAGDE